MNKKEEYLSLIKDGKNVFEFLEEFKKENNSIDSMVKLREIFPQLTLLQAKEILIINDGVYESLDNYQADVLKKITGKI